MEIKMITPKFGVHGQIVTEDLATIKDAGFQTIVCNRPDGEGEDQTDFKTIQNVAEKLGLTTKYLPVQSGLITDKMLLILSNFQKRLRVRYLLIASLVHVQLPFGRLGKAKGVLFQRF